MRERNERERERERERVYIYTVIGATKRKYGTKWAEAPPHIFLFFFLKHVL